MDKQQYGRGHDCKWRTGYRRSGRLDNHHSHIRKYKRHGQSERDHGATGSGLHAAGKFLHDRMHDQIGPANSSNGKRGVVEYEGQEYYMPDRNPACEPTCKALTTLEGKVEGAIHTLVRLDKELNGKGQPGIRQDISAIRESLARLAGTEIQREREQINHHAENSEKLADTAAGIASVSNQIGRKTLLWTIAGVSLALAGVLVSILAIMAGIYLARHQATLKDLLPKGYSGVYTVHNAGPQDADLPTEYDKSR